MMKKTMKSYLVFTSTLYRLVMFAVLPAAWAGMCLWIGCRGGMLAGNGVLMVASLLLPIVETISDSWLFAGIQTSNPWKLDYLKTSCRGKAVMRRALIADMLRKLISSGIILGLSYPFTGLSAILLGDGQGGFAEGISKPWGAGAGAFWCLTMFSFFFSVLGTFLSRYGNMIWLNVMIGYGVAILEIACLFLPGFFLYPYVYGGLFGLLGVGVSALAVHAAMERMERSYYDQWPCGDADMF